MVKAIYLESGKFEHCNNLLKKSNLNHFNAKDTKLIKNTIKLYNYDHITIIL